MSAESGSASICFSRIPGFLGSVKETILPVAILGDAQVDQSRHHASRTFIEDGRVP